ncbi:MAG: hypothetical protein JO261_04255 [Alphaproteobacteria bacterium]|nr:hypothetical protein [Alphaproteobacteria bacterium]MBV9692893.1 hypothetical protein [Alphaproteobacteria bacterium]
MAQLVLPLGARQALGRADFVVAEPNREAVAFIESWPRWPQPAAALHGPPGSGKSHLAAIWAARAKARIVEGETLSDADTAVPLVIENAERAPEPALFAALENGTALLLTSSAPPAEWKASLPDLASRFRALLAFALWAPDDDLLSALARKLFADRQLQVSDSVIAEMLKQSERSPAAIRSFVARLDETALAQKRAVTPALVRSLLAG